MRVPLINIPKSELTRLGLKNKQQSRSLIQRHIASFVSQEPHNPRLLISKMHNHTSFPTTANVGIVLEKNSISLYIINRENKWQKLDLNLSKYQNINHTLLKIINKDNYNNDDNVALLEAYKLDNVKICPPISKQLFNSNIVLPISFDVRTLEPMRKHNGEMLNATMELIKKTLDQGKATIILDDTLQRWNIGSLDVSQISDLLPFIDIRGRQKQIVINEFRDWQNEVLLIDHKEKIKESMNFIEEYSLLYDLSKLPSMKWKLDNKGILEEYIDNNLQFNLISWDDLKNDNNYIKYLDLIMTEYDENPSYRSAIDGTIHEYLDRNHISRFNIKYKLYILCALKYIFEECAIFAQLIVEGLNNNKLDFHVYPSGETSAIKATRELTYKLFNATGFYPVKLNFKAKE